MPLPKVKENETRQEYIARCLPVEIDAGTEQGQAYAVCTAEWEKSQNPGEMGEYSLMMADSLEGAGGRYKVLELGTIDSLKYGPIHVINRREDHKGRGLIIPVQEVIENYKNNVLGTQPFIDEEHDQGKARGWITGIDMQDGAVYLNIEWNPAGENLIKNREYSYLSIDIGNTIKDGKIIPHVLKGAALTNKPVYKNQEKIQLSETAEAKAQGAENDKNKTGAKTMDKIKEAMSNLLAMLKEAIAGNESEQTVTDIQDLISQLKAMVPDMEPENSEMMEKADQTDKKMSDVKLSEYVREIGELKAQVVKLSQENMAAKFDAQYLHKKITPAQRENFFRLYLSDSDTTSALLDTMPDLNLSTVYGRTGSNDIIQLSEEDEIAMKSNSLDPKNPEDVKKYQKYLGGIK